MATTITLKEREAENRFMQVPREQVQRIVQSGDKDALWDAFSGLTAQTHQHDVEWLMQILRNVPRQGRSLPEQARTLKLINRLADVEQNGEVEFEISDKDKRFLIDHITDRELKYQSLPVPMVRFLLDLENQFDEHFLTDEGD